MVSQNKDETQKAPQLRGAARKTMESLQSTLSAEGVTVSEPRSFKQNAASGGKQTVVEVTLSGSRIQDPYKRFWFKKRLAAAAKDIGVDAQVDRWRKRALRLWLILSSPANTAGHRKKAALNPAAFFFDCILAKLI